MSGVHPGPAQTAVPRWSELQLSAGIDAKDG